MSASSVSPDQIIRNAVASHPMLFITGDPKVDDAARKAWGEMPLGDQNWHIGTLLLGTLITGQVAMAQRHMLAEAVAAQTEVLAAIGEQLGTLAELVGGVDVSGIEASLAAIGEQLNKISNGVDVSGIEARLDKLRTNLRRMANVTTPNEPAGELPPEPEAPKRRAKK